LRILPALILIVLLTTFVMGPLVTVLPAWDYLRNDASWFYLRNILLYPVYTLPGVFAANTYPAAINGSLWSLPAEVCMYLLTPLVISRQPGHARASILIVAGIFSACGLYCVRIAPLHPVPVFYGTSLVSLLDVAAYFQFGAIFAVFALNRISRPIFSLFLLLACGEFVRFVGITNDMGTVAEVLLWLTLPYAVVSVGNVRLTGRLARLMAWPDVSYGMYLYGFPVEQLISAHFHGQLSPPIEFALAFPVTVLCGLLSWRIVEKGALRLKPGRPASLEISA
jgi:peptidoglycan/LPS O-acetylase OafA/YrhL